MKINQGSTESSVLKENGCGSSNHMPCLVCRLVSRSKIQSFESTVRSFFF